MPLKNPSSQGDNHRGDPMDVDTNTNAIKLADASHLQSSGEHEHVSLRHLCIIMFLTF